MTFGFTSLRVPKDFLLKESKFQSHMDTKSFSQSFLSIGGSLGTAGEASKNSTPVGKECGF